MPPCPSPTDAPSTLLASAPRVAADALVMGTSSDRLTPLATALADAAPEHAVDLLRQAVAAGTLRVDDIPALLEETRDLTRQQRPAERRTTLRSLVVGAGVLFAVPAAQWTAWYRLTPWPDSTNGLLLTLMRRLWRVFPSSDWTDARLAHVAALLSAVPPDVPDEFRRWVTKEWVDGEDSWHWQLASSFPPSLMARLTASMQDQAPHLAAARATGVPFRTAVDVAPYEGLNWRTQSAAVIRSTIARCLFLPDVSNEVHVQIVHVAGACLSEAGDFRVPLLRQFMLQQPDLAGWNRAIQTLHPNPVLSEHFRRDIPIHVALCHLVLHAPEWPANDLSAQTLQDGPLLVPRALWSQVVTRALRRVGGTRAWARALRSWWHCREEPGPWPEVTPDLLEVCLADADAALREWATIELLPHVVSPPIVPSPTLSPPTVPPCRRAPR